MLASIRRLAHEAMVGQELDDWMERGDNPPAPRWRLLLGAAWSFTKDARIWLVGATLCKLVGHDYGMESHVSPESGWEKFTCRRCWEQREVIYY
jgi:hypothetical protein